MSRGPIVKEADQAVTNSMMHDANFAKYLEKVRVAGATLETPGGVLVE